MPKNAVRRMTRAPEMVINRSPAPAPGFESVDQLHARASRHDYSGLSGPDASLAYLNAANGGNPADFARKLAWERKTDRIVGWAIVLTPILLIVIVALIAL
ncbi:MAG: hypothetical protein ACLGIM_06270 [Alphaproteobacteria bacterium]